MKIFWCAKCMKNLKEGTEICPHCGFDQNTPQPDIALRRYTVLHGRYLVGNMIGQGGFGLTYVGLDLTLELKVAIKEYYPSGVASRVHNWSNSLGWNISDDTRKKEKDQSIEHFLREARRMARLDDVPGVVRVRDTFRENETAYIVMDFVDGETLKSRIAAHGPLHWEECQKMLMPIADSLAIIHDHGFLHRDIAPDNIMIRPDGSARLLDMGAVVDMSSNNGQASMVVVKSSFSAPEQYDENAVLGSWTDVYAMAATIWYCLTGKLIPTAIDRMMTRQPAFLPQAEENVPAGVAEVLRKALEMEPGNRIRDMRELRKLLEAASAGTQEKSGSGAILTEKTESVRKTGSEEEPEPRDTTGSEEEPGSGDKADSKEEPGPVVETGAEEESESVGETDSEKGTEPVRGMYSDLETGTDLEPETESEKETDPKEKSGMESEPETDPEEDSKPGKKNKGKNTKERENEKKRKSVMIPAALAAILVIAAVLIWFSAFRQNAVPEDYVAYFTFDGTLRDETGKYIATAIGYQLSTVLEIIDWTYVDGTVGQAVAINPDGDQVGLNTGVDIGSGSYTVAFTAKAMSVETSTSLVWIGRSGQVNAWNGFLTGLGSAYDSAWNGAGTGFGSRYSSSNVNACADVSLNGATETAFEWTSIAFSVDREENSTVKLYYGGVEVAAAENVARLTGTALLYIGADYSNEPCYFYIDELYVYGRVLSQKEIAAIAKKSGLTGVEAE